MSYEQSLLRQDINQNGSFAAYMAISLGCHVIMMACLIMMTGFNGCQRRAVAARVIDVDLVSLPDVAEADDRPVEAAPSKAKETLPPPEKAARRPAPAVTPMAPKESAPEVKTSLKKKTFHPGQSVENAIARLENQVDRQPPPETADDARSRLKQAEPDRRQPVKISGRGAAGSRSRQQLEAIEIYKLEIRYHILKNWVYSSQLAGTDEALRTVIGINIAADGRITDTWFDKRSGNDYYDNSALKAVMKSNPLPRLPDGYETYTLGLEFTPSDLQ